MKQHRYVHLLASEIASLCESYQANVPSYFRDRCQCLLFSNKGLNIQTLAKLFNVQTASVRHWFDIWEDGRVTTNLFIKKGRGRKPILDINNPTDVEIVKKKIEEQPLKVLSIIDEISDVLDEYVSRWMLIFFLKKLGYTYRRIRKSLKYKQNAEEYIAKLAELNSLIELEQKQHLTIYYGDESGFSETPYIPYGWQKKGDPILLPSKHGKRMNVFGLMSSSNELHAYTQEKGSIKSDFVIQSINDFVMTKSTKGRSVIILDNARIHHSKAFNAKIIEWEKENVLIFFLPTYSPHLNLIETFWRKCKYEWLLPKHYKSWEILTGQLRHIFKTFGAEYTINFRSNLNVA